MAAPMTCVMTLRLAASSYRRNFKPDIFKPISETCAPFWAIKVDQRLSSTNIRSEKDDDVEPELVNTDEIEENRIEKLRDISGLSKTLKRKLQGQMAEISNDYQRSMRYQRRLFGRLGAASGIDPRVSWTGRQKAMELAQLFKEWEPPLEERLAILQTEKDNWAKKMEMREKKIAENMAKMDKWIMDYRGKSLLKDKEAQKKEEKKQKLLEEAREYFGYRVDPRDAKFQEMLEEKEKQEKALAKKQKKEMRLQKLVAQLQHMADDAKEDKN